MYKHPIAFLSVNNLTAARYAAAMMTDYIGFCLDSSNDKFITVEKAKEIMGWLSGVKYIGEFYKRPADEIAAIALALNLELVLLHDDYTAAQLDLIPCKKIVCSSTVPADYYLNNEMIKDTSGKIFAMAFDSANEDETGVINFDEITSKLLALEV